MILILIIWLIALIYFRKGQKKTGVEAGRYKAIALILFIVPIFIYIIGMITVVMYQGVNG